MGYPYCNRCRYNIGNGDCVCPDRAHLAARHYRASQQSDMKAQELQMGKHRKRQVSTLHKVFNVLKSLFTNPTPKEGDER